ncbi:MAG: hypothetical protein K2K26_04020 [Muribaculaceae bacterium]|nr:hypothetical protein [Muribaculaceae bacterium]
MKYIVYLTVVCLSVFLTSCGNKDKDRLTTALQVLKERPDSAYLLLKSIDYNSLDTERDKAEYILARAKANLYNGRSLMTDTMLNQSIIFFKNAGDTTSYIEASMVQARHLRSLEKNIEAYKLIEVLSSEMPKDIQQKLNQELLSFSFADKDFSKSLEIIDKQIELADNEAERFNFEIKKITPLISLGRSTDAVAHCDSLFALSAAPAIGSDEWLYIRMNYAAALGEKKETAAKACTILEDIIQRTDRTKVSKLIELYIPLVNLYMNAGKLDESEKYLGMIEKTGIDIAEQDAVAAAYLDFLKITLDYKKSGALSLSKISNVAQSLRKVSKDLEIKKQERDDALESAYDLSKNNYELTIKHQRMWLIIILIAFISTLGITFFWYLSRRRHIKLLAAEERIETLEELLKSANNPATDKKQGLLKRLLLQQLGIIKTFAESPTTQNQEALRKISNIGNSDTPIDSLVKWDDMYPVIDELYNGFHENLLNRYPGLFSEREIQIICLIRAGFSTKEISVLIQQSSNSIYVSKTAIRKKLGLQPKEDFMESFITSIPTPPKA